jgi:hypothetical protein
MFECRLRDSAVRATRSLTPRRAWRQRQPGLGSLRREEFGHVDAANAREPVDENAAQMSDLLWREHAGSGADFCCARTSAQHSPVSKCCLGAARLAGQANDALYLGRPQVIPSVAQRTSDAGALLVELG